MSDFETQCMNGVDDDGDGKADCADEDCAYQCKADREDGSLCLDGLDNDNDGSADCKDPDCKTTELCGGDSGTFSIELRSRPTDVQPDPALIQTAVGKKLGNDKLAVMVAVECGPNNECQSDSGFFLVRIDLCVKNARKFVEKTLLAEATTTYMGFMNLLQADVVKALQPATASEVQLYGPEPGCQVDESAAGVASNCDPRDFFTCRKSGECIQIGFKCDKNEDCTEFDETDYSDEEGCNIACVAGEAKCPKTKRCVDEWTFCDECSSPEYAKEPLCVEQLEAFAGTGIIESAGSGNVSRAIPPCEAESFDVLNQPRFSVCQGNEMDECECVDQIRSKETTLAQKIKLNCDMNALEPSVEPGTSFVDFLAKLCNDKKKEAEATKKACTLSTFNLIQGLSPECGIAMATGDTEACGCLMSLDMVKTELLCNVVPPCQPSSKETKILCQGKVPGDPKFCRCEDPSDTDTCTLAICDEIGGSDAALSAWKGFENLCEAQAGGIQAYRDDLKQQQAEAKASGNAESVSEIKGSVGLSLPVRPTAENRDELYGALGSAMAGQIGVKPDEVQVTALIVDNSRLRRRLTGMRLVRRLAVEQSRTQKGLRFFGIGESPRVRLLGGILRRRLQARKYKMLFLVKMVEKEGSDKTADGALKAVKGMSSGTNRQAFAGSINTELAKSNNTELKSAKVSVLSVGGVVQTTKVREKCADPVEGEFATPDSFRCPEGMCVTPCDGSLDCASGEDEDINGICAASHAAFQERMAQGCDDASEFTCKGKIPYCIPISWYCDGSDPNDPSDGADCKDSGDPTDFSDEDSESCIAEKKMEAETRTDEGPVVKDWIGLQFAEPQDVKCMRLYMPEAYPVKDVQVYACRSEDVFLPGRGVILKSGKFGACNKMEPNILPIGAMEADSDTTTTTTAASSSALSSLASKATTTLKDRASDMPVIYDGRCLPTNPVSFGEITSMKARYEKSGQDIEQDATFMCFCKQQATLALAEGDATIFSGPWDTEVKQTCENQFKKMWQAYFTTAACGLAIVIVNQILKLLMKKIVEFEKHRNITEVTVGMMTKLFISQWINTALVVLFVNAYFFDFVDKIPVIGPINKSFGSVLGGGSHADLDSRWFQVVGVSIIFTVITQILSTTVPAFALGFVVRASRKLGPKFFNAWSQEALNDVYTNPEFNLALRFAQSMNVIFMIVMYSAGLPLLLWVGVAYCVVAFWLDKATLLRFARTPPQYDEMLVVTAVKLLPVAAILHCALALYIFGNQILFPSDFASQNNEDIYNEHFKGKEALLSRILESGASNSEELQLSIEERVYSVNRAASIGLLVIFSLLGFYVFVIVANATIGTILAPALATCGACLKNILPCFSKKNKGASDQGGAATAETYHDSRETMVAKGIEPDYELSSSRSYRPAYTAIQDMLKRAQNKKA
jgi:hypothetical protein